MLVTAPVDDDLVPGCGPLGGLHAALTAARAEAVFVVACDMPYVTAPFALHLLSFGRAPPTSSCRGPNAAIIRSARYTRGVASSRSRGGSPNGA